MRIAVVGTGYVGLTTGACLARLGHTVVCADVDAEKVGMLRKGLLPILEDGLQEIVRQGITSGRLSFVVGAEHAVADCDFVFMCLPTPQGADGSADLTYLLGAAKEISSSLQPGAVVINKSTVPVGSADQVSEVLGRSDVHVASNPEFLREGTAVVDFFNPDRIVIGADSREVAQLIAKLYDRVETTLVMVSTRAAELIKYAANTYLAMKLSYVNSVAELSEALGTDAAEVLRGVGLDSRIGGSFMVPGPGWGGSCFPKDTMALVRMAEDANCSFPLLRAAVETNQRQLARIVQQTVRMLDRCPVGKRVAMWGLTFKAGTDDTRQSPAIEIARQLHQLGAVVHAFDPAARHGVPDLITRHDNALSPCDGADVLLVLTEWSEFNRIPLDEVAARLTHPRVLDARGVLSRDMLHALGFDYYAVGSVQTTLAHV